MEFVQEIIEDAVEGRKTVHQAVTAILNEMSRGVRILVIDENLLDLEKELAAKRYTTKLVELGVDDEKIKRKLKSRVLVTRNGKDFIDDRERYYYGLIWVKSRTDSKTLAKKIEKVMMRVGFTHNLTQVVIV